MVPVTSTVVANRCGDGASVGDEFFQGFSFVLGPCDGLVQVIDVRLMMLAMVDLHRRCVDMGFQCIVAVRQGC